MTTYTYEQVKEFMKAERERTLNDIEKIISKKKGFNIKDSIRLGYDYKDIEWMFDDLSQEIAKLKENK